MSELLNGIFECLDINSGTGLATEDNLQSMTSFQRLFYTQVHEKIGIDAVYFLRDENGIAKIPLIYFSAIQKYDAKQVAELHRLSWNLGEAPLLFVVTPDEILIYNNYETPRVVENGNLDPNAGIIETLNLTNGLASQRLALKKYHRSLIESGEYLPSYMWNTNGWLCDKLGLTIKSQTQVTVPTTYKEDIYSETLGVTVKAGDATGMSAIVTTETEEGITIESECIGKVYSKEDFDKNEWSVYGEPDTTITVARPATVELTCATVVNRIPDIINARPGFVPTAEIGELNFKTKALNEYVK